MVRSIGDAGSGGGESVSLENHGEMLCDLLVGRE